MIAFAEEAMRLLSVTALAGCLALQAGGAEAWGPDGHQTVGAIADQLIAGTPTAKHVRKILGSTLRMVGRHPDRTEGRPIRQERGR